jgi:hypothetical protein
MQVNTVSKLPIPLCSMLFVFAILFGISSVQAGVISFDGTLNPASPTHADSTDFSNTGLDIGKDGYIFFNWGQLDLSSGAPGAPIDANINNQLPTWVVPNFDPNDDGYSFGAMVTTSGSVFHWNTLRLPGGEVGLSGAMVDPEAADNSNNSISQLWLGAGVPDAFLMHVVVDTTLNEHDPSKRLRARAESADGSSEADVMLESLAFNGIADVYTFRYGGWAEGDIIKIQLNSGDPGIDPGITGIMFDAVPIPPAVWLFGTGLLGLIGIARRKKAA